MPSHDDQRVSPTRRPGGRLDVTAPRAAVGGDGEARDGGAARRRPPSTCAARRSSADTTVIEAGDGRSRGVNGRGRDRRATRSNAATASVTVTGCGGTVLDPHVHGVGLEAVGDRVHGVVAVGQRLAASAAVCPRRRRVQATPSGPMSWMRTPATGRRCGSSTVPRRRCRLCCEGKCRDERHPDAEGGTSGACVARDLLPASSAPVSSRRIGVSETRTHPNLARSPDLRVVANGSRSSQRHSGASDQDMRGEPFALRLQWRDRVGISPTSLDRRASVERGPV